MKNSRRSFIKKVGLSGALVAGGSLFLKGSSTSNNSIQVIKKPDSNFSFKNNKVPISLLIDDGCPLVHVYWFHVKPIDGKGPFTKDGRLLVKSVPNSFMEKFCDVVTKNNISGKLSIVPSPGGIGDIANGIPGYDNSLITEWINMANSRLSGRFDFSPEMLTHNHALDLKTGKYSEENEAEWSTKQDRTILTPYLIHCLEILKKAGINATGITSPWDFGTKVEGEYTEAIIAAQKEVYNHELSWYFLHTVDDEPQKRPWIALRKENCTLVSIASNMPDHFWPTIDSPKTDTEYINYIADKYITANGKEGNIIDVLNAGGWPILVTHWQSLFSNGLETGLNALEEVGKRVNTHLKDRVEWNSCMDLTKLIVNQ